MILLDHCPGAIARNSRAFPDTGPSYPAAGELKSIILEGNVVRNSRKASEEIARDLWPCRGVANGRGRNPIR